MQKGGVVILKLHNAITIETDQVIVLGFVEKIGIVVGLVTAEIHLTQQSTFDQQGERPVNGGSRNGVVELARFLKKFLRLEVVVCCKGSLDNDIPLLGAAQPLAGQVSLQALSDTFVHVKRRLAMA